MYEQLKQFGKVKIRESMAKHTTFRIGGPVDFFVSVDTVDALVRLLRFLDGYGTSYFLLGGGSNMLVSDDGFRGVAIEIKDTRYSIQGSVVEATAGCVTAEVAMKAIVAGLTGFEWGVGVPGTIGGAVRGNAGAMGGEMGDFVQEVEVYRDGEVVRLSADECRFGYRDSVFKHGGGVVLRAWLQLTIDGTQEGKKRALAHLKHRSETQPQGQSIGCIFKNYELSKKNQKIFFDIPEEFVRKGTISAGWLIHHAGLQGLRIGDAEVSAKHCNFILNKGSATAKDVLMLIETMKEKVYTSYGVELEEEIQVIN